MQRISNMFVGHPTSAPSATTFKATEISSAFSIYPEALPVSVFSCANGRAAAGCEARAGEVVTVWGYVSATAKPRVFLLSEHSAGYCQMCGISHTGGSSMLLRCKDDSLKGVADIDAIMVRGTVSLNPPGRETFFDPCVELTDATRYEIPKEGTRS